MDIPKHHKSVCNLLYHIYQNLRQRYIHIKLASVLSCRSKFLLGLFLLIATALCSSAQSIQLQWVKTVSGTFTNNLGTWLVVDSNKSLIVLGSFQGTVDFDPGPGVYNMTSVSSSDIFIAKYDTAGNFIWAKQLSGQLDVSENDIAIDKYGDLIITGQFQSPVDFDPGPGVNIITPINASYGFLLKLDYNGNFVWVEQLPYQYAVLHIDFAGNIILGGTFGGTVDFDPGPGTYAVTSSNPNGTDMAVLKLNANGNFVWLRQIRGQSGSNQQPAGVRTDPQGNIYFGGAFSSSMNFNPGPGTNTLTAAGNQAAFLLKLDSQGNYAWATQFGAAGTDEILGLEVDKDGNVFSTGVFQNTVDFDPGPAVYNLTGNAGFGSTIVWKLDKNGSFVFAKALQGAGNYGQAITLDSASNVYVQGTFLDSVDFDPGPGIHWVKGHDIFTLKLDSGGNYKWVDADTSLNGNGFISAWPDIKVDVLKNVYTTGLYTGPINFDPGPGRDSVTGTGIYIHKLSQCHNTLHLIDTSSCDSFILNSTTYSSPGVYYQTLTNSVGCDSIIQLNLTRKEIYQTFSDTACFSYFWRGNFLVISGIYRDTLPAVTACDSIIELNLTINGTRATISDTACGYYQWNGKLLTASGVYIDSISSANGCDSVLLLNLIVHSTPSPSLGKDTVLCPGDSVTLSPGIFNTYAWSNNTAGSTLTVTDTGIYYIQVTDMNNCTASDSIRIEASTQCGVGGCSLDARTKIYPTPFSDYLMIDLQSADCEIEMNLYDVLGQLIIGNLPLRTGHNEIPLYNLASAMYFYRLHSASKLLLTGKILKIR